ncbi:hypothetical protein G3580_00295 [Nitrogeniibacter mangrovi]|uniref:Uncharacterized protein n=1 Tax=Nitrogeniibacter mangrovi TaxID=2016596 RepID=A0A6C1B058_9RHOO|nr:hypothetical protein [Nitrogeniibacter mangrovi]QID16198.1 hypothetical protein G3580_00295 [Nitrogeniibacter mangrovi]
MSRFWGEPVELWLTPAGCALRAGADTVHLPTTGAEPAWPAALAAHLPARARVLARVDDRWVRYLVCRWPTAIRGRKEREAWLAHQFRQVHGLADADWVMCRDADPAAAAFVACALPRALVEALQAVVRQARGRLVSLTGAFVARYNALARQLDAGDGALALTDGGRLTLGVWRDGQWTALLSRALGEGDALAAWRELTPLCVTGEAAPAGVLFHAGTVLTAPEGWTTRAVAIAA